MLCRGIVGRKDTKSLSSTLCHIFARADYSLKILPRSNKCLQEEKIKGEKKLKKSLVWVFPCI